MEHAAVLKRMDLFAGLDSLELVQVSKRVRHLKVREGETVVREGEPGNSLFIVKAGRFRAFTEAGAFPVELGFFEEADLFGELVLLDGGVRSATVEALADGELLELGRKDFEELLSYSVDLQVKLLRNLVQDLSAKLRRTNDQLAKLL
jgi:CRP-like cAMP-binding protein